MCWWESLGTWPQCKQVIHIHMGHSGKAGTAHALQNTGLYAPVIHVHVNVHGW